MRGVPDVDVGLGVREPDAASVYWRVVCSTSVTDTSTTHLISIWHVLSEVDPQKTDHVV